MYAINVVISLEQDVVNILQVWFIITTKIKPLVDTKKMIKEESKHTCYKKSSINKRQQDKKLGKMDL